MANPAAPPRPKGVPEKAEFHPADGQWVEVAHDKQGRRHGRVHVWSREGRPLEEADFEHGERHGAARRFGARGKVTEEGRFRHGERTGVFRFYSDEGLVLAEREFHQGELHGHSEEFGESGELELEEHRVHGRRDGVFRLRGEFADPAVEEVQGTWRKGLPESPWTLLGPEGAVLRLLTMDSNDALLGRSEVFSDAPRPADAWFALAAKLEGEGRRNEALVAGARGAAGERRLQRLVCLLERLAVPLLGRRPIAIFEEAREAGSVSAVLTALRTGGSAAHVFGWLASLLEEQGRSRAALELVNAALLVDPERAEFLHTRALALMGLGLAEQALHDANALAPSDPDRGEFLLDLGRVLFPTFDFWPARVRPETTYSGLPDKLVRTAEEIRGAIGRLATRLMRTRAAMLERVRPEARWLVPDLAKLLPKGARPLKRSRFEKAQDGGGVRTVEIDEARGLDPEADLPALLRTARADWAALTWLCWAAGLDALGLPKKLKHRPDFSAAAGMSAQRLWRCRDRRLTGGAQARAQGAIDFEWEGLAVDGLSPALVPIAEAEWAEVQAVMKWLAYEDARSIWQSDLRDS